MHLELPHAPYMLNPDGSLHETVPNSFEARLAGDEVALGQLRSNYLNQVQYVDLLLGQFVARLRVAGLYDPALIVVTADHGVSWLPDAPGRTLTDANAGMILPIPLFIKLPENIRRHKNRQGNHRQVKFRRETWARTLQNSTFNRSISPQPSRPLPECRSRGL